MKVALKKKSPFLEPRKKFDPSEKEKLCEICDRPLVVESYRWSKEEGAFFLSRRTEISHREMYEINKIIKTHLTIKKSLSCRK